MRLIIPYIVSLLVFGAMDAVWLKLTVGMYRAQLADLLIPTPRLFPAIAFYLLQILGIQIFVVARAGSPQAALALGAAFGFFTYATYDLTNWAILKNWTYSITAMDMCWGAVVTACASLAGYFVRRWLVNG